MNDGSGFVPVWDGGCVGVLEGDAHAQPVGRSLLDHFSAPQDARQPAKVLDPLPEIPLLPHGATLAGADDLIEIELWGKQQLAFLCRFRLYGHGVPSRET